MEGIESFFSDIAPIENRDGNGKDDGTGFGYGIGNGAGGVHGTGSGEGSAVCRGDADGGCITAFNGEKVYHIEGMPIIIRKIEGNTASGVLIRADFSLSPVFVVRYGKHVAYGASEEIALSIAAERQAREEPLRKRLHIFNEIYPDRDKLVDVGRLSSWYETLSGCCENGRNKYCIQHDFDYNGGLGTVNDLIEAAKEYRGAEMIRLSH